MEFRDSLEAAAFIRARGFYSQYLSGLLSCSSEFLKEIYEDEFFRNNLVIEEAKKELSSLVDTEFYESYQDLREEMLLEVKNLGGIKPIASYHWSDFFNIFEELGTLGLSYLLPGDKSEKVLSRPIDEHGIEFIKLLNADKQNNISKSIAAQRNMK